MTCTSCGHGNLPGNVRCIYCGTAAPVVPDFELGVTPARPAEPVAPKAAPRGLLAGLALLILKGKSLLSLFTMGKLATLFVTMAVSARLYAFVFGWKFALGFVICILIHELGHVYMAWRHGIKASAPMFIPFAGALITVKNMPEDPVAESELGVGGPVAGFIAALVCAVLGVVFDSPLMAGLASAGFAINLINMAPFNPLDGARVAALFSPGNWNVVLIGLLLYALKDPVPILWPIIVVGFFVRLGVKPEGRHNLASPMARARMTLVFLVLCIALAASFEHLGDPHAAWGERSSSLPVASSTAPATDVQQAPSPLFNIVVASLAALLAALVFGAYHAVHKLRVPYYVLRRQMLAWCAGAALAVAYGADSAPVLGYTAVLAVLIYLAHPSWLPGLVGTALEGLGAVGSAQVWRERALALRPTAEERNELWLAIIDGLLDLECGEAALQALEKAVAAGLPEPAEQKARALLQATHYRETLEVCERLLADGQLLAVRGLVADMAAQRDWHDEARAQADQLIWDRQTRRLPRLMVLAYSLRGDARQAARWAHRPADVARISAVKVQAALQAGDGLGAAQLAASALQRLPESLRLRYWHGVTAKTAELARLAEEHPGDWFGQQAARRLAPQENREAALVGGHAAT